MGTGPSVEPTFELSQPGALAIFLIQLELRRSWVVAGREGGLSTMQQDQLGSEIVKLLEWGEFTRILKVLSKSMRMFVYSPLIRYVEIDKELSFGTLDFKKKDLGNKDPSSQLKTLGT